MFRLLDIVYYLLDVASACTCSISLSDSVFFFLVCFIICRVFFNTLQHCVLNAFRMVLVSSPASLKVFRDEGIWELIFSENFFYFGPASDDLSAECCTYDESPPELLSAFSGFNSILQMEVISFVEFAATSDGSAHNLVGLRSLDDVCFPTFTLHYAYLLCLR